MCVRCTPYLYARKKTRKHVTRVILFFFFFFFSIKAYTRQAQTRRHIRTVAQAHGTNAAGISGILGRGRPGEIPINMDPRREDRSKNGGGGGVGVGRVGTKAHAAVYSRRARLTVVPLFRPRYAITANVVSRTRASLGTR